MMPALQKRHHARELVSSTILQLEITKAVRTFDASCELFMGVFVERAKAKSRSDANWAIKGIKFGKANRDKCVLQWRRSLSVCSLSSIFQDETYDGSVGLPLQIRPSKPVSTPVIVKLATQLHCRTCMQSVSLFPATHQSRRHRLRKPGTR